MSLSQTLTGVLSSIGNEVMFVQRLFLLGLSLT